MVTLILMLCLVKIEIQYSCFRDEDKQKGKCFGGIARLQTAVKKLRASDKNVLWLNAGDFYQGTVWYSHFKWKVVSRLVVFSFARNLFNLPSQVQQPTQF